MLSICPHGLNWSRASVEPISLGPVHATCLVGNGQTRRQWANSSEMGKLVGNGQTRRQWAKSVGNRQSRRQGAETARQREKSHEKSRPQRPRQLERPRFLLSLTAQPLWGSIHLICSARDHFLLLVSVHSNCNARPDLAGVNSPVCC